MKNKKNFLDFLAIAANLYLLPTAAIEWVVKKLIKNFNEGEKMKKEIDQEDMIFKSGDDALAYMGATIFTGLFACLLDGVVLFFGKLGGAVIIAGKAIWKYVAKAITSEYPWEASYLINKENSAPSKKTFTNGVSINIPEPKNNMEGFDLVSALAIFAITWGFFAPLAFLGKLVNRLFTTSTPAVDTSDASNYGSRNTTPKQKA